MDKIRWTSEEMSFLAEIVSKERLRDPKPHILLLIQEAQKQLPEDRRRPIRTISQVKPIVDLVEVKVDLLRRAALSPKPVIPTPEEFLDKLTLEKTFSYVMGRILEGFQGFKRGLDKVSETQNRLEGLIQTINGRALEKMQRREGRKRIMIFGLLNQQMGIVQAALKKKLDLKFVSKDVTQPSFGQCDKVVMCCNFVGHSMIEMANSEVGRDNVILHKGGISELIGLLEKMA